MIFTQLQQPILVLIRGLPGSGKSYVAAALQQAIGDGVIALDPDATDYKSQAYKDHVEKLTSEGVDASLHAYRYLRSQAHSGIINSKLILWNQPFTNREIFQKMIAGLQAYAIDAQKDLQILVVEVITNQTEAKNRVTARKQAGGHGPSDNTFSRFSEDYTSFADEGFLTISVHGQGDVQESVSVILQALGSLAAK